MSAAGSIVISNYTGKPIDITCVQDAAVAEGDRKITHTIHPNDSYVLFTNRVEALSWEKQK